MDTFVSSNSPYRLCVKNVGRIDDSVLLEQVLSHLRSSERICLDKKKIGPSEDYWDGRIDNHKFTLYFDIDYLDIDFVADSISTINLLSKFLKAK